MNIDFYDKPEMKKIFSCSAIIKDLITGKEYLGNRCVCGSENIYVLHTKNQKYPDDVSKDTYMCRCEDCRRNFHPEYGYYPTVKITIQHWNDREN